MFFDIVGNKSGGAQFIFTRDNSERTLLREFDVSSGEGHRSARR